MAMYGGTYPFCRFIFALCYDSMRNRSEHAGGGESRAGRKKKDAIESVSFCCRWEAAALHNVLHGVFVSREGIIEEPVSGRCAVGAVLPAGGGAYGSHPPVGRCLGCGLRPLSGTIVVVAPSKVRLFIDIECRGGGNASTDGHTR
ncbi:unnamed protein product [Laminaria digitata]